MSCSRVGGGRAGGVVLIELGCKTAMYVGAAVHQVVKDGQARLQLGRQYELVFR